MIRRWLDWWRLRRARKTVRLAHKWIKDSSKAVSLLRKRARQLKKIGKVLEEQKEEMDEELSAVRETIARQSEIVEAQRAELQVLNEVTIPNLEAAARSYLQRYDTEMSIMVQRQVAAGERVE